MGLQDVRGLSGPIGRRPIVGGGVQRGSVRDLPGVGGNLSYDPGEFAGRRWFRGVMGTGRRRFDRRLGDAFEPP